MTIPQYKDTVCHHMITNGMCDVFNIPDPQLAGYGFLLGFDPRKPTYPCRADDSKSSLHKWRATQIGAASVAFVNIVYNSASDVGSMMLCMMME
eukprot:848579-Ditylum_brightwellii.AAC.1